MKKLLTLSIIALTAVSCTNNSYNVSGTLEGLELEGKTIYLTDFTENSAVDSTVVNEDGTFTFEGKIDTAKYVMINAYRKFYSQIVLEPGNILFDTINPNMGMAQTYGTPLNDAKKALEVKCQEIFNNPTGPDEKLLKETVNQFIIDNYQTILGAIILEDASELFSPDEFNTHYKNLGTLAKTYKSIHQAYETNKKIAQTAEGKQYTDFTIENGNIDGTKAALSDYVGKGKMVLVDFWASWCGPCIQEIPNLKNIHEKYGDKLTILSVAVWDKRDATLKAIEEHNTPWAQIVDAAKVPTDIYGISGIPHIMLIGEDGTILNRNIRGAQIEEAIKKNL